MLPGARTVSYSGLARMRSCAIYGWLGQKMANYSPQVMQQTVLVDRYRYILNREAHDDAVLHALLVLLPSAAYTLAEDFSYW